MGTKYNLKMRNIYNSIQEQLEKIATYQNSLIQEIYEENLSSKDFSNKKDNLQHMRKEFEELKTVITNDNLISNLKSILPLINKNQDIEYNFTLEHDIKKKNKEFEDKISEALEKMKEKANSEEEER